MDYFIKRHIPFYYLYDTKGSELYNEITQLEQYYPYRSEEEILNKYASEMIDLKDETNFEAITLVEFGAGYSLKTEIILKKLLLKYKRVTFVPIDVSPSACEYSDQKYSQIPHLTVKPYVGTYDNFLLDKITYPTRVFYLWLGSSIGNLAENERIEILKKISDKLTPVDRLLMGLDTVYKDKSIIYKAYNDDKGVTRKFIMNILTHLKYKYDLSIKEEDFMYDGVWNDELFRMEMYIKCLNTTEIKSNATSQKVKIKAGERILIEYSHKFSTDSCAKMAEKSNLVQTKVWYTDNKYFMFSTFVKNGQQQTNNGGAVLENNLKTNGSMFCFCFA
ncbi:MAG: L-histidine N(alpha)-methyltransferase [Cyanobacteria bacterium]|nr:L-histidine N(alpha)-methyltransferase [Cyanobacteria bacterium CG_2015-04_32_10]